MRTKAEELTTALEIARVKRTLKRLPHINKRGKVSLLDLFPQLNVGEIVFERKRSSAVTSVPKRESAESESSPRGYHD